MTTNNYVFFYGGIFSQWYSYDMEIDGVVYNTAEQYMMAMKADYFGDTASLQKIMATNDPSEQKAQGRMVKGFDAEAWNAVSRGFVYKANLAKFSGDLKQYLLDTGDREIVEASPYDKIWGIGMSVGHPDILDKSKWQGKNWLGECIMNVRETLRDRSQAW
jgi:ribA/ribD-fused uncharacterized protein